MTEQLRPVNVQALLDSQAFGSYRWLVFILCFLIVLLDGFDTAAIGYVAPSLMREWGVAKPDLGPVLSAALFGLAAGALSSGPLADRFGRKRILVGSVLLFGLGSLASWLASSLQMLGWLRFLTGVGLGAAMPNAVTLISEYAPARQRAMLTNAMFCGFPLGASLGGFVAAWMIPEWGWRSVFLLGGILPLLLVVVLVLALPESVRYMVSNGWPGERIRAVLLRIAGAEAASGDRYVLEESGAGPGGAEGKGSGIGIILSRPHRVGTLMLWLAYFMGLVVFYALINWMPVLFREIGMAPRTATLIAALFPLGGVAAVLFGWLMDRCNPNYVVALGYGLTALSVWGIGQFPASLGWLMAMVFVAGVMLNAAQSSLPALAASFYPTRGRATGVAWMLGIGRFGGIAGSFLVAGLVAQALDFMQILSVLAVPALLAALALWIKTRASA